VIKKFNVKKTKQLNLINNILMHFYRKKTSCDINITDINRILIIDFSLIGDMIMAIPFLKNIHINCPKAIITMVCMPWGKDILGDQNLVDEFVTFNGKDCLNTPISWIKEIRLIRSVLLSINKYVYDIGFEPKGDLRHTLFLHYTNCKATVSYNYTGGSYLVTNSFLPPEDTYHLIDEKLKLLELSGFKLDNTELIPRLIISKKYQSFTKEFISFYGLSDKIIIGVHPGASNVNKQFGNYSDVIIGLKKYLGSEYIIMIFEGPGEEEIADQLLKVAERNNICYIHVKKTLKEYITLVSICNYMLCNDSAAGHIAAAYGIPVIVIFGPVSPEASSPKGINTVI
jgi:heptosyltransferase-2